ncbi:IPT/TIG domain-containing protein [Actinacidiphila sp. bgisy167]|uniref:IPT/TIG domain-containing protein n=1 Tax=Actinacidiphila sp. bgisy167 TaxID=3413797 RepID=UPI003D745288
MPPTVSAISPSQGHATGGTLVTLTGTGLTGATAVRFAGTPATSFTVHSTAQITALTPPGTPGGAQVTVTGPDGTSNQVTFTYTTAEVPAVTALAPTTGPATGGTLVTLTGTGLTGATAVRFGATPAASFTVHSPTRITAAAPPGTPGGAPVTVTTPGGTSAASTSAYFFHAAPPALTAATPALGPTAGGTTVTLTGSHLLGATAVLFGTSPAPALTAVSATQITVTAPAGTAGPTQITVATPGGTSNPVAYTHLAAPALTALTPHSGPTAAGTVITLTGTGLAAATAVAVGGTPAAFTVVSDTQITATAPAGTAGPTPITVTTPGGTSTTLTHTRLAPPAI